MADKKKAEKKQSKVIEKKEVKAADKKDLPPLPSNLTEEQLVEFREAFDLFVETEEPKIPATSVVTLMRKLGLMPSDKDIMDTIEEMDSDGTLAYDGLAFEHFCCVAAKKLNEVYTPKDVIMAFQNFDIEENGMLHIDEVKRILQTMGDPLTEEEMNAFIESAEIDPNGFIKYEEFVKEMMLEF